MKNEKFLVWIGEWIDLLQAIINIFIVPFGKNTNIGMNYSFWLLQRKIAKDILKNQSKRYPK